MLGRAALCASCVCLLIYLFIFGTYRVPGTANKNTPARTLLQEHVAEEVDADGNKYENCAQRRQEHVHEVRDLGPIVAEELGYAAFLEEISRQAVDALHVTGGVGHDTAAAAAAAAAAATAILVVD